MINDNTPLDYGSEHRGTALINVPADYLLDLYENNFDEIPSDLRAYIEYNMEVLKFELKSTY